MADTKISGLPASTTPLAGTEVLPIVQSSSTVQVSVANLTAGRAVATGALTVTGTLSATGTLSGGTSGTAYSFSGSAPATSLTLDASGRLGIGTPSPAYKLDVTTATAGFATILTNTNGASDSNGLYVRAGTVSSEYNLRLSNTAGSTDFMVVKGNGNVGIGTSSPNSNLQVSHPSASTNAIAQFTNGTTGTGAGNGLYVGVDTSNEATVFNFYNSALKFGTNGTERARIDSSGNVVLGSSANGGQVMTTLQGYSTNSTNGSYGNLLFSANANYTGGASRFLLTNAYNGTDFAIISSVNATTTPTLDSGGAVSSGTAVFSLSGGIVTMSAYGAGAATFSAAGVISSVSDETWKIKDGVPVDTDAMLKKLEPGYWYYNDEKKETFGSDRQLGFYAQNVNAAIGPEAAPIPETIITKNQDGSETTVTKPWGYYDRSVLAITVMSLQKALATIETLTARVAQLESKP